jgi:uncharacterized NAD(P)/FAD-binding protein YdhS
MSTSLSIPHGGHTLCIVGGGAIGAALFNVLVDRLSLENALRQKTRIVVFERSERVGPGLAYAKDDSSYVLNQSAQTMSLVAGHRAHFCEWLEARGLHRSRDEELFCPRHTFGDYVEDQFIRAREKARARGLAVTTIHDEVSALTPTRSGGHRIVTREHPPIDADIVALTLGNLPSKTFRHLEAVPSFVASPYPSRAMCARIPKGARVAILGTGLSAIDAVLALFAAGHESPLLMASRSGLLPAIRGPLPAIELNHVTRINIARVTDHGRRPLRWTDVARWLELELEGHDLSMSWDRDFPAWASAVEHYTSQLAAAEKGPRVWQAIGEALNPLIEVIWNHLAEDDKRVFMGRFYNRFMSHWVPIPIVNGKRVLALLKQRRLAVQRNLTGVTFEEKTTDFRLHFSGSESVACDYIVNATGAPRQLSDCNSPLLESLHHQGIVSAHEFGGIRVDFESLRVLGKDGHPNPRMFALGNLTFGTHLFTSTLELNVQKADRVAGHIVTELLQRNAGPAESELQAP